MPSTKNGKEKTKLNKKQTNYEFYKEKIAQLASLGSFCGTCLARKVCEKLPDSTSDNCKDAFLVWCNQEYKGGNA